MATYTKFEELAIRKQEQSYKIGFAKKNFAYSCNECCSKNLRGGVALAPTAPSKKPMLGLCLRLRLESEKLQKILITEQQKRLMVIILRLSLTLINT